MVTLFIALEDLVKVSGSILPQLSAIDEIHNVIIFSVGLPSKCLIRIAIDTKQRSEYRLAKGFLYRRNSEHWLAANLSNHCRWLYFDRIPRLWQKLLQHPLCQRFGASRPTRTRSESISERRSICLQQFDNSSLQNDRFDVVVGRRSMVGKGNHLLPHNYV